MRPAVRDQFVRVARPTVALKVVRRRNEQPPQRHNLLAHDPFAADIGRLNTDVVAVLDRIVVMQLDEQIGMLLLEAANVPRELMTSSPANVKTLARSLSHVDRGRPFRNRDNER